MKQFDYNSYMRNNPLLKEDSEKKTYTVVIKNLKTKKDETIEVDASNSGEARTLGMKKLGKDKKLQNHEMEYKSVHIGKKSK